MFDLFEHLSTTLRRTFAPEDLALPSAPATAQVALAGPVAPASLAAVPPDPLGPAGGEAVAEDGEAAAALGASEPGGALPVEPVAIPLDPETLEPVDPRWNPATAPDARSGEPSPVPRSQSPRYLSQLEPSHAALGRSRPLGTGPLRTVVVIPAYNEEQTLAEVIQAAKAVPEVSEVIVVSDGSTDATAAVAREHGAICIELRQNVGKGGAMKVGIDRADADLFVFLDADLIGVTPVHIQAMIHPVLRGDAAVAIAQLEGGRVATDLASVVAPNLSGQRAVTRAILQGMSGMETTRFGVEIAMKRYIKRNHIPVVRVPLDISHRTKEEKLGLMRGFLARLKEYWEIVKVAGE
jgi:hypothetical protein